MYCVYNAYTATTLGSPLQCELTFCGYCLLKAKFHYAIWSQTGPRLVADLLARASELDDTPNSSSLQVCDQLRTCLRPDSVMEFGFNVSVMYGIDDMLQL